jgi:hypothetical protein
MRKMNWKLPVCFLTVVLIYTLNLHTPVFWGDEADMAIFSRNALKTGVPVGFDGRNLAVINNCASVSKSLLKKRSPWVQFYTGALSILLFGDSTLGVRLLFALIGAAAFFPLYAVVRKKSNNPELITMLVLASPQIVLFQRNARYFSILIFLFSFLVWIYFHPFKSAKLRMILAVLCSVVFFHTHQLTAFCTLLSLLVFCSLKDRKNIGVYLTAFLVGLVSWALFYLSLEPLGGTEYTITWVFSENPRLWFFLFINGFKATILDLDFINCIPIFAWVIIVALGLFNKRMKKNLKILQYPLSQIIWINLCIQILANSALIGFETKNQYSVLRSLPHLIAAGLVPLFLVMENTFMELSDKLVVKKVILPLAFFLVIFSNAFTFSYWFDPLPGRTPRFSWWPPVYGEILDPKPDSIKELLDTLVKDNEANEDTIFVRPSYMDEILEFYAGHQYLILPPVIKNSECERTIIKKIGPSDYSRFSSQPKWLITFLSPLGQTPPGYVMSQIAFYRDRPDGSRPELTRHGFIVDGKKPTGYIYLYKRL